MPSMRHILPPSDQTYLVLCGVQMRTQATAGLLAAAEISI
jgi:hypothetical protein